MSKVVAICNQKGGVGKTTTSINLATALAMAGRRTLLIDIDPQGNATSGLGIDKNAIQSSVYDLLLSEVSPDDIIQKTFIDNLSVIPSNISLTGAEVELVGHMGREYRLKKAIARASGGYEFIIIDCPPSLGLLTINALTAAGSVLIPIQCEYYALEGLSQLSGTIDLVRENLNTSLSIEGVLLTMADFRTKLTSEVIDEVKSFFKDKVYRSIIPRNIRLTEAPGFGKPIALYDKNSVGAVRYQEFANEFLGIKTEDPVASMAPEESSNQLEQKELGADSEQNSGETVSDSV